MDVLLVFLLSTGFVGGLFHGLKKTTKSFLSLGISLCLVSLLLSSIAKLIFDAGFLKEEFYGFLETKVFCHSEIFSKECENIEDAFNLINNSSFPKEIKGVLISFCKLCPFEKTVGQVVSKVLYSMTITIISAFLIFVTAYIFVNLILTFAIRFNAMSKDMFFTKRILSSFVGLGKGILLFVAAITAVCYFANLTNISFIHEIIDSSTFAKMGESLIQKNISALISGMI